MYGGLLLSGFPKLLGRQKLLSVVYANSLGARGLQISTYLRSQGSVDDKNVLYRAIIDLESSHKQATSDVSFSLNQLPSLPELFQDPEFLRLAKKWSSAINNHQKYEDSVRMAIMETMAAAARVHKSRKRNEFSTSDEYVTESMKMLDLRIEKRLAMLEKSKESISERMQFYELVRQEDRAKDLLPVSPSTTKVDTDLIRMHRMERQKGRIMSSLSELMLNTDLSSTIDYEALRKRLIGVRRSTWRPIPKAPTEWNKESFHDYVKILTRYNYCIYGSSRPSGVVKDILDTLFAPDIETLEPYRSTQTYNYAILHFVQSNDHKSARRFFRLLQQSEHQPDVYSFNIMLSSLYKDQEHKVIFERMDYAFRILCQMRNIGVHANEDTWLFFFRTVVGVEPKLDVMMNMQKSGIPISPAIATSFFIELSRYLPPLTLSYMVERYFPDMCTSSLLKHIVNQILKDIKKLDMNSGEVLLKRAWAFTASMVDNYGVKIDALLLNCFLRPLSYMGRLDWSLSIFNTLTTGRGFYSRSRVLADSESYHHLFRTILHRPFYTNSATVLQMLYSAMHEKGLKLLPKTAGMIMKAQARVHCFSDDLEALPCVKHIVPRATEGKSSASFMHLDPCQLYNHEPYKLCFSKKMKGAEKYLWTMCQKHLTWDPRQDPELYVQVDDPLKATTYILARALGVRPIHPLEKKFSFKDATGYLQLLPHALECVDPDERSDVERQSELERFQVVLRKARNLYAANKSGMERLRLDIVMDRLHTKNKEGILNTITRDYEMAKKSLILNSKSAGNLPLP
ncbi:hypothetical protein V1511DRAFT_506439 [Dipodascopsis uninucleata]